MAKDNLLSDSAFSCVYCTAARGPIGVIPTTGIAMERECLTAVVYIPVHFTHQCTAISYNFTAMLVHYLVQLGEKVLKAGV